MSLSGQPALLEFALFFVGQASLILVVSIRAKLLHRMVT
jgi:hypothetical protein